MALIFTPQGNTTANYVDGSYDSIYVRTHKTAFLTVAVATGIGTTGQTDVAYTALSGCKTGSFAGMIDTTLTSPETLGWVFCNIGDQEAGALTCAPTPNKITKQDGNEVTLSTKYELK